MLGRTRLICTGSSQLSEAATVPVCRRGGQWWGRTWCAQDLANWAVDGGWHRCARQTRHSCKLRPDRSSSLVLAKPSAQGSLLGASAGGGAADTVARTRVCGEADVVRLVAPKVLARQLPDVVLVAAPGHVRGAGVTQVAAGARQGAKLVRVV